MRIAIIRLDALGDAVLTTGMVRATRETYPDAEITMICGEKGEEIWKCCPYLDHVAVVAWPSGKVQLPSEPFDIAINPRPAPDYFGCPGFPRKRHVGFRQRHFVNGVDPHGNFTDLVDLPWPLEPAWQSPFRLLQYLGYKGKLHQPEVWPKRGDKELKLVSGKRWFALGLGAGASHKIWHGYAELAAKLDDAFTGFVLIGAASERPLANRFKASYGRDCLDFVGQTTVPEMAAILDRCELFIGNDSGPKHIAAAMGVPVLEVSWLNCKGPMFDYDKVFEPVGSPCVVVSPDREFTPQDTFSGMAVQSITLERVLSAATGML